MKTRTNAAQPVALPARIGRAHAVAIGPDGWLDIMWIGQWDHPDGPEAVDAADIALTLDNLQSEARAGGADWTGIPLYIGHPEEDGTLVGAPSQAWLKQFRTNAEGRLQGLPEWCGDARAQLIDSRAYKYTSAYEWGDLDPETHIFHPAYISSIGLTNNPVKKTGQHPLANATGQPSPGTDTGAKPMPDPILDPIASALGADGPEPEVILARANAIIAELGALRTQFATELAAIASALGAPEPQAEAITARANAIIAESKALTQELATEIIGNAIIRRALRDTPEARANAAKLIAADRVAARAHFADTAGLVSRPNGAPPDPMAGATLQRAHAVLDPAAPPAGAAADRAGRITARANACLQQCGGNWDTAWNRATADVDKEDAAAAKQ